MSVVRRPPELADGGYWYVVKAVFEGGADGAVTQTPGAIPRGWCAWYREIGGVSYAAVRYPQPVLLREGTDIPVSAVLTDFEGKPRARVEGR